MIAFLCKGALAAPFTIGSALAELNQRHWLGVRFEALPQMKGPKCETST